MKKIVSLFLLVCIFFITGCKKENTIVGKWVNGSYVYTFNEDKTCSYDASGTTMKCTYEIDGNNISILYTGNTVPFKTTYKIEGKTLHILDSFGTDVKYTRK